MEKRVTIYDIAREACVSAATVSYIINNREEQKISEETKKKVWQIVNLLNYKPSVFAKNLRFTPEFKLIAVYSEEYTHSLCRAEFCSFLSRLSESLLGHGYDLLLPGQPYRKIENADAILAYRLTPESFHQIGDINFIPLIAVDTYINDPVFFQITADYAKRREEADRYFAGEEYVFAALACADPAVNSQIRNTFRHVAFLKTVADLQQIDNYKNILVIDETLAELMQAIPDKNVFFSSEHLRLKSLQIADCVQCALSHETFPNHCFQI